MSDMALKRLHKELKLMKDYSGVCTAYLVSDDNMLNWEATFRGPANSPFDGGIFRLAIRFPTNYPFDAPNVQFKTKVYHPNISAKGVISLDILDEMWSLALTVPLLLLSICSLLAELNPDKAISPEIAELYGRDRDAYNTMAQSWTLKHATPDKQDSARTEVVRDNGSSPAASDGVKGGKKPQG